MVPSRQRLAVESAQTPRGRAHRHAQALSQGPHRPRRFALTWPLQQSGAREGSLLPSPPRAAQGTPMVSGPMHGRQAARSMPGAKAPRPMRRPAPSLWHVSERARRADRAPRSVDPARGSRSAEGRVLGHRRSGSTAACESAARAAAQELAARVLHGPCVDPSADRVLWLQKIAAASRQTAASARRWNVWDSSVLGHSGGTLLLARSTTESTRSRAAASIPGHQAVAR